jgi:hypothetical protein
MVALPLFFHFATATDLSLECGFSAGEKRFPKLAKSPVFLVGQPF